MNDSGFYNQSEVDDKSIFEGEMTWEAWEEKYKPVNNHFTAKKYPDNPEQSFETYGEELDYIRSLDPRYVWTEIQGDSSMLLVAGVAFVNRLSYYVCEEAWLTGDEMVLISVEVECECYIEEGYPAIIDDYLESGDPECKKCEGTGVKTVYAD